MQNTLTAGKEEPWRTAAPNTLLDCSREMCRVFWARRIEACWSSHDSALSSVHLALRSILAQISRSKRPGSVGKSAWAAASSLWTSALSCGVSACK